MSIANQDGAGSDTGPSQNRFWRYGPLIFWMSAIFFASTDKLSGSNTKLVIEPLLRWLIPQITSEHLELFHLLVRKAAHFTAYAILGLLAARAFGSSRHSLLHRRWFMISLLLICIYALSDEYHQSFVASRTASLYDSVIDVLGGLTALVVAALWKTRQRRRQNRTQRSILHGPQ